MLGFFLSISIFTMTNFTIHDMIITKYFMRFNNSNWRNKVSRVKKIFAEFKSIFISEDLLKENEEHGNDVNPVSL